MCGIAGWLSAAPGPIADPRHVLACLHHRGPDSSGFEVLPNATLIHTRLQVIDLSSAGHQPAWSADRSVAVVFNGEIYNHHALRQDLERRGHHFRGHSDTEVIAPLYQEHGDDFVDHLRGMFAIGLVDLRKRRLLLARDRFGIKPLYWAPCEGGVAFSSEIPALRTFRGVDLTIDAQAISDYVALHHIPPPQTMHRGVRSLEPGMVLSATLGPTLSVDRRRFHNWSLDHSDSLSIAEATERAGRLLDRAVASQLESDVPLGGMLSGGIDSGLVCHSAGLSRPGGIQTFGVSFDDPDFDEGPAIEAAAAAIGSHHETLRFASVSSSWEEIQRILLATGQPFADSSILAVDALSQLLRQHVTVAVSGDGGDEAFAGYDHFGRLYSLAPIAAMPARLRAPSLHAAAAIQRALPALLTTRLPTQLPARLQDLAAATSPAAIVADHTSWVRATEHRGAWRGPAVEPSARLFEPTWSGSSGRATIDRMFDIMTEADVRIRLAGDFLPKVDIASMRHSLEVRVPMLDEDLFQFGLSLPRELKRPRGGQGKRVLRELASRRMPVIATLPKHGFGVPFDHWVGGDFRTALRDAMAPASPVHDWLDPRWTQSIVDAFVAGTVPGDLSRQGLYQRVLMITALEAHLRGATE